MPIQYEPPIVVNESSWIRRLRPLRSHVVAAVFFLPFIFLLAIHRYLGLSDAMMIAPAPGQPHSMLYNVGIVGAFWFGFSGYLMHVLVIAERSPAWAVVKLGVLAALWTVSILLMPLI